MANLPGASARLKQKAKKIISDLQSELSVLKTEQRLLRTCSSTRRNAPLRRPSGSPKVLFSIGRLSSALAGSANQAEGQTLLLRQQREK